MLSFATVVATLLRLRARAGVVLACLATMLCATTNASASPGVQPKTCVWGFELAAPLNTWLDASATSQSRPEFSPSQSEVASGSPLAARGATTAFDIAKAGGKHAGTLKNYAGRSAAEIQKAIGSYERQVALHQQKIANPAQFAERWGQMSAQEQAGLVNKWGADAARNQELADVLRGLLGSR